MLHWKVAGTFRCCMHLTMHFSTFASISFQFQVADAALRAGRCAAAAGRTCRVKRSEVGILGAALRRCHSSSVESEVLRLSCRGWRAAPSLRMPSEEPVVASHGPTKTAILTMLTYARAAVQSGPDEYRTVYSPEPIEERPCHIRQEKGARGWEGMRGRGRA